MKAKVQSLEYLVKYKDRYSGLDLEHLEYAGQEFTVAGVDGSEVTLEDDPCSESWRAWMFVGLEELYNSAKRIDLVDSIGCCAVADVLPNGNIQVDDNIVTYRTVVQIYTASKKAADSFKGFEALAAKPKRKVRRRS
jgi:hypothetical protein